MIDKVLKFTFLGNSTTGYLTALGIFIAGLIAIVIFKKTIFIRLEKLAQSTHTTFDDFLIELLKKIWPIFYVLLLYLSAEVLNLYPLIDKIIKILTIAFLIFFGVKVLLETINYIFETKWIIKESNEDKSRSLKGLLIAIKVVVWGLAAVIFLDNLGVNISALVAGLGIGSIAVALAAQNILGDLFNFFIIIFDQPFVIGDFIVLDNFSGTVEHIGIKTTKIRSLTGEQIIFSNSDLTKSRLRNFKRMNKRRATFTIGVTYETDFEKLKKIPSIITDIINSVKKVELDRVHFSSFGDFSLNYDVVYYVLNRDYNQYMDAQQEINFKIKEIFDKEHIDFAYPTQTVFLNKSES